MNMRPSHTLQHTYSFPQTFIGIHVLYNETSVYAIKQIHIYLIFIITYRTYFLLNVLNYTTVYTTIINILD